jgi:APA family basic amino acid/polyamine antiporter
MAIFILFSTFGCNNGLILAGSRIYYAMSKDKLFFKSASELNKNGVPSKAMILQCIWTCLLCLSGTYGDLLDYVVFAVLIFYVLTIIGVYILRIRKPNEERPYKAFGYPVLPAIYVILAIAVIIILLINKPNYTIPGLIIVLTGLPVYFIWKATTKKREV